MTSGTFDAVIAGAGIVGAACAEELARAGFKVAVVEPGVLGGGATAAGMGHIVVMDDSEAQFALTRYSQQLWDERESELPADVQFTRSGTLWVAADEEEMDEVHRKAAYLAERDVPYEILDARTLAEAEPNLRSGLPGALCVPGDSVIYPPCAARFFLEKTPGLSLRAGRRVVSMTGRSVRLDDGSTLSAGLVVNATGTWAPELTPGLDVRKRKGHLVITDRYPGFARHQLVELGYLKSAHGITTDSVAFNLQPRANGQMLLGSSRQYGVEHAAVEAPMISRMIARGLEYMPRLAELSAIRCWTGFRAATPDKLPLIGPTLVEPGLYLATGHEGLGITTSLGTARLLADQIAGRSPAIPWGPYLPSRTHQKVVHA
jgi:glycine/D-amino acid oxidase-like deaminating enzyme